MGTEIERKFLLKNDTWRGLAEGTFYRQGYLNTDKGRTVRIRTLNDKGFLTIKGPAVEGIRKEFEYEVPYTDAVEMLEELAVSPIVEKKRYKIPFAGFIWEVDEFSGSNRGLILAEIELEHPAQPFDLPPWIGREVTNDSRFYNSNLARNPYISWGDTIA